MNNVGFTTGSLIKGRWTVMKKIGQGAFGEIFSGKNIINGEQIAIKVEKVDTKKQVLRLEVAVLKKLQLCPYVCRFITCGRHNDYNYMVMELLGENLSELRRKQIDGKFSLGTTLKLGIQMIQSLQAVHDLGYLHRDVKPSNFAIGLNPNKRNITYLIDFGLARRFVLASGEVRPARESTGFRGTARYASINSHLSKDLGRRDDLWSIFYVLIEFAEGQLPWRKLKDKDQIGDMKQRFNTPELVKDLPPQFAQFMKHLKSLNYEDRPNYLFLQSLLNDCYSSLGLSEGALFDWELPQQQPSGSGVGSSSSGPVASGAAAQQRGLAQSGLNNSKVLASPSTIDVEASGKSSQNSKPIGAENDTSPNNPPLLRRDSASISQIANSSESNNKESGGGSWNQKSSSPRHKQQQLHNNDNQLEEAPTGSHKHLKANNNNNNSNSGVQSGVQPIDKIELSTQHQQKSSTPKCCSSKCTLM
ncbi:hypothetical protein DICPUDRAFT_50476 [Dictyostelium purpureum]|uniref:Protein kinase domain-containing protein n=1 Tax=Dictyostelium purpureum TaxID=5786 RepID=F0ZYK1_DICPU|nr:uncharacterized protein DICPUDRAFT_50476 [Dictyostelium purpureum]EGC30968.1 hypothetical protein DICPUDRAFT_50476 [Dictyostelium purpureum]|eukprot:XP_003292495.1 hypothetical protein DICPUDRAFT_50476 [Dictyostelium purpureum]